jgi:predicted acylesterase/phospholipase RssA
MPPAQPFLIGINMPGAVSAGAYTAGVLDFLIEALDAWYDAKVGGQAVPMHDVSIEVFSGASAGGMCAAIASVMVQGEFEHIHDTSPDRKSDPNKPNRFYESWVNQIDIRELLKTDDIRNGGEVVSLLDCGIIDRIANYALEPGPRKARTYVSESLTLFLTLTNVTGIPYRLEPDGPVDESTLYHADWLRFETVRDNAPSAEEAHALPLGNLRDAEWDLLRLAAKATGAFPIFLAPRIIPRNKSEYKIPRWQSIDPAARQGDPILPSWPRGTPDPFLTLNVDGGVIDNDPFALAHDYLASRNITRGGAQGNKNPRDLDAANAAVITVTPFPATSSFNPGAAPSDATVVKGPANLASVLITQSRFFGESLSLIMNPRNASRFLVAPSDDTLSPDQPALQCASLGAFGGFFDRKFRAHDFMLGRRNCQWFLRTQFALTEANPLSAEGLRGLSTEQRKLFQVPTGRGKAANTGLTLYPIIPLCTDELRTSIQRPARLKMGPAELQDIVTLIYERGRAVIPALAAKLATGPRFGIDAVDEAIGVFGLGKAELAAVLTKALGDSIAQE